MPARGLSAPHDDLRAGRVNGGRLFPVVSHHAVVVLAFVVRQDLLDAPSADVGNVDDHDIAWLGRRRREDAINLLGRHHRPALWVCGISLASIASGDPPDPPGEPATPSGTPGRMADRF